MWLMSVRVYMDQHLEVHILQDIYASQTAAHFGIPLNMQHLRHVVQY